MQSPLLASECLELESEIERELESAKNASKSINKSIKMYMFKMELPIGFVWTLSKSYIHWKARHKTDRAWLFSVQPGAVHTSVMDSHYYDVYKMLKQTASKSHRTPFPYI